jgi:putative ABC transport system ATP-binding protein
MIELNSVRKVFNQGKPNEFTALRGVSLTIDAGKATVFKGPSGSGKTTLLSLIGCMARPTSGRIHVKGREITSLPERFLTDIRRKEFGFIFQHLNLIHGVSALENAMLPAYTTGEKVASIRERAMKLMDLFSVSAKAHFMTEWLSGGEAQRVTIVRALINDPPVIIADEPTAHLDSKLSADFMEIVEQLKRDGKTVLITSHDPLVFESPIVDRVIDLRDGRVEESK